MRITVITFIIFSLIVQGHGRPLQQGPGSKHLEDLPPMRSLSGKKESALPAWFQKTSGRLWKSGSKHSEDLPLMRSLPGEKESALAAWFQKTSDRFWNSVIPGRPTLAKVVVAGTSLIVIVLGLGLWLFIYVYRKFHPEYLQVETELLQGKRVMRPDTETGLFSMMLQKLVPEKYHAVKKHRDIEEGNDEEDQSRPFSAWLMAASNFIVENEQAREESEDDSADEEEREGMKSKAVKKYVAKKVKKLKNEIKDKTVAIKKEVKHAKTSFFMATVLSFISFFSFFTFLATYFFTALLFMPSLSSSSALSSYCKNIAKKAKNIMAKKTKNIKVKKAKDMATEAKNIMAKKFKKIKRRK